MKLTTLVILSIFSISNSFSQATISGEVMDSFGEALSDTNILIKGTERGTTSADGKFNLTVAVGDTLSISHLGFRTQEVFVQDYKPLLILFEVESLDEILITSYINHTKCYTTCTAAIRTRCGTEVVYSAYFEKNSTRISTSLYPNPSTNGQFSIKFPKSYITVTYHVITITGQRILTKTATINSSDLAIDLSSFAAGMYLVQVEADGERLPTLRALKG